MDPETLYSQIQELVKKEATDIATSVYDKQGTQYGVPKVPYHIHNQVDAPQVNFSDLGNRTRYIILPIYTSSSTVAVGTNIVGDNRLPFDGNFLFAGAWVQTAGTTSTTNVDIKLNGTSIFATVMTIDSTETSTQTAAVVNVLKRPGTFLTWDTLTVNVDSVSTTPPVGLWVYLKVVETSA